MSDFEMEALEGRVLLSSAVSFAAPLILTSNQPAHNLALGDFTDNGLPSLAVTDPTDNQVNIFLNQGNGNFIRGTPVRIADPFQVVTGDFFGNGQVDLAVITDTLPKHAPNLAGQAQNVDGLALFIGNGNGTFTRANTYRIIQANRKIVVADFNNDGLDDIAITTAHGVGVLLNTGDGTFAPEVRYQLSPGPVSCIALGDFNGDGIPDIVAGVPKQKGIRVMLGTGTGTFTILHTTQLGTQAMNLAVGDFTGNGKDDVAVVNGNFREGLFVRLGNGDGTFSNAPLLTGAGAFLISITAADLTGDGLDDLAVVDFTSTLRISVSNGDGTFATSQPIPSAGPEAFNVYSADLTGNGKQDLILLRNGNVYIYMNTTPGPI